MKALLTKKSTIVLAVVVLFTSITKAQIPDNLKNSPPFKMRGLILKSLNKPHAVHQFNEMRQNNNSAINYKGKNLYVQLTKISSRQLLYPN